MWLRSLGVFFLFGIGLVTLKKPEPVLLPPEAVLNAFSTWSTAEPKVIMDGDNCTCNTVKTPRLTTRTWFIFLSKIHRFVGVNLISNPGVRFSANVSVANWKTEQLCTQFFARATTSEDDFQECAAPVFEGNVIKIQSLETRSGLSTLCEVEIYVESEKQPRRTSIAFSSEVVEHLKSQYQLWMGIAFGAISLLGVIVFAFIIYMISSYRKLVSRKQRKKMKQRESFVSTLWMTNDLHTPANAIGPNNHLSPPPSLIHQPTSVVSDVSHLYCDVSLDSIDSQNASYYEIVTPSFPASSPRNKHPFIKRCSDSSSNRMNRPSSQNASLSSLPRRWSRCKFHKNCTCADKPAYIELVE